jgi:hypothetical protein
VSSGRFWHSIPRDFAIISSFSRSEEMGEILGPIMGRFVGDISLSIPILAFWYSAMALPIVLENEVKFFEPKKRIINTKAMMNHSAPAIFISIDEKTNYDLPSRINEAVLPYLDSPILTSKEMKIEKSELAYNVHVSFLRRLFFFTT